MSGITGNPRGSLNAAAEKLRSTKETLRTSKKARSAVAAAAGTVVLTGALVGVGINAHAEDVHKQQVAAAAEATQIAQAKASESASAEAAMEKAAAERAAAEKAAADKAAADAAAAKAAAVKAAADKAAADKAAADAAAKALAERQAAASAANRDEQRQPIAPTTSAPKSDPTTSAPTQSYAPVTAGSARAIAQGIVPAGQFGCFDWIIDRESGWNIHATNPSSGAYGLPQALPGDKMASAGPDWQNDAATQIRWALSYMDSRYGSPCGAESFWQSHGWY